jgi:probable rRNA maturation factor
MLEIDLYLSSPAYKPHTRKLPHTLQQAAAILGRRCTLQNLSLAVVGNRRMATLHQRFLNIPGPTDVLTFPLHTDPKGRPLTGEVVLCLPYATTQAKAHNIPLWKELSLYALHGLLHLSGYNDLTDRDYRLMHQTEDKILSQLGLGQLFYPAPANLPSSHRPALHHPASNRPRARRRSAGSR